MFLAVIAPWGTKSYKKLPKSCLYGEKEVFLQTEDIGTADAHIRLNTHIQ
jgi:hypothetical protein